MRLINIMASTLDGRIGVHANEGDEERTNLGISSPADQAFLRNEIRKCDAIVVGATSIRANGGCLDALGVDSYPEWFILARDLLPADIPFWRQDAIPRTIVSQARHQVPPEVNSLVYGDQDPASFVYTELESRGFERVLLFGGGIVNKLFYERDLVDELKIAISPLILGKSTASFFVEPSLSHPKRLILQSSMTQENFVFLDYKVSKSD